MIAAAARACDGASCAGTELAHKAAPNREVPDADADEPDNGADAPGQVQSPENSDDDEGGDSEEAVPPNTAEPHGCIFRKGPLDLIV